MRRLLIITLAALIGACTFEKNTPPIGPEGSWWLGGDDGGVFVDIKDDDNANDRIFIGTIYFDADKSIWYQGPLKLVGNIKYSIEDHDQYIAWDGERLLLKESSYLEAINPVPPL